VVEHSIGNGEVDSSILSGSTIFAGFSADFVIFPHWLPTERNQPKTWFACCANHAILNVS
jgi:hypothetical protein